MAALLPTLTPLIAALKADGYTVIGPARRGEAIVLTELDSVGDLPHGWGVATEAGSYRLRRRDDNLAFGHSTGPQSWKTYLHPQRHATDGEIREGRDAVASAAGKMGRQLPSLEFFEGTREAAHWDDIAQHCLSCGNCTMVCPTCFCTTVTDTSDLTGQVAQRWQTWDSCFDLDFSYLHGGPVRTSTRSRYRQWLSHKLSTWHDQFGESGCVGCGRCIVWCPVGIDITVETQALAQEVNSDDQRA